VTGWPLRSAAAAAGVAPGQSPVIVAHTPAARTSGDTMAAATPLKGLRIIFHFLCPDAVRRPLAMFRQKLGKDKV
jgi:hypothetical protein